MCKPQAPASFLGRHDVRQEQRSCFLCGLGLGAKFDSDVVQCGSFSRWDLCVASERAIPASTAFSTGFFETSVYDPPGLSKNDLVGLRS